MAIFREEARDHAMVLIGAQYPDQVVLPALTRERVWGWIFTPGPIGSDHPVGCACCAPKVMVLRETGQAVWYHERDEEEDVVAACLMGLTERLYDLKVSAVTDLSATLDALTMAGLGYLEAESTVSDFWPDRKKYSRQQLVDLLASLPTTFTDQIVEPVDALEVLHAVRDTRCCILQFIGKPWPAPTSPRHPLPSGPIPRNAPPPRNYRTP
ncbi:MAG: hypothetical protein ABI743_07320 [bacterium]